MSFYKPGVTGAYRALGRSEGHCREAGDEVARRRSGSARVELEEETRWWISELLDSLDRLGMVLRKCCGGQGGLDVTGGMKLHRQSNSPTAGLGSNSGADGVLRPGQRGWEGSRHRGGAPGVGCSGWEALARRVHGGTETLHW